MSETMPDARPRPGLPVWGKIAIGCTLVVLVGAATCIGVVHLVFEKGADLIEGLAREEWAETRAVIDQMMTDEGARRLYAEHPGLAKRFPTERDFLDAAGKWRPGLEPVPERIPIVAGRFNLSKGTVNGVASKEISYTNGKGSRVMLTWRGDDLVDIDVDTTSRR